jgi:hypothetical protein
VAVTVLLYILYLVQAGDQIDGTVRLMVMFDAILIFFCLSFVSFLVTHKMSGGRNCLSGCPTLDISKGWGYVMSSTTGTADIIKICEGRDFLRRAFQFSEMRPRLSVRCGDLYRENEKSKGRLGQEFDGFSHDTNKTGTRSCS